MKFDVNSSLQKHINYVFAMKFFIIRNTTLYLYLFVNKRGTQTLDIMKMFSISLHIKGIYHCQIYVSVTEGKAHAVFYINFKRIA